MVFKVNNLTKCYNEKIIVKHFSYEFKPGLYLFTGCNGCGKSTTLKMLADLVLPSNYSWQKNVLKISYLCEHIDLHNLKVKSFLKLFSKLSKTKINYSDLLLEWNVPNKKMHHLSKGNKQKIGIIMMILTNSDVYIFDEPTDSLDCKSIKSFIRMLAYKIQEGKIILVATHEKEYFEGLKYQEICCD